MTYRCRFCGDPFDLQSNRKWHERKHIEDGDALREEYVPCDCDAAIVADYDPEGTTTADSLQYECLDCGGGILDPRESVALAGDDPDPRVMTDGGQSMDGTERALYNKYDVYKDGELQSGCFVLKPPSDPAARVALLTYAHETDNDQLAEEIEEWLKVLSGLADTRERFVEADGRRGDPDV